jgi:hypothetical protein
LLFARLGFMDDVVEDVHFYSLLSLSKDAYLCDLMLLCFINLEPEFL